jgi:hypothetical protein
LQGAETNRLSFILEKGQMVGHVRSELCELSVNH